MSEVLPERGEPTQRSWEAAPGHRIRAFGKRRRSDWPGFVVGVVGAAATAGVIGAVVGVAYLRAADDELAVEDSRGPVDATASIVVEQHGSFTARALPPRLQTRGVAYSGTIRVATADRRLFGEIDLTLNEDFHLLPPATPRSAPPPALVEARGGGAGAAADVGHRRAQPDLPQDPRRVAASTHVWGTVTATLGGVVCQGPLALSSHRDTGEGGGALALRCSNGSMLGGGLHLADLAGAPPSGWESTLELTGFYTAGE